jgi:PEGA domain
MASTRVMTGLVLAAALAAAPAFAADGQHRRGSDGDHGRHQADIAPRVERAVPRSSVPPRVAAAPRQNVIVAPRQNVVVAPRYNQHYNNNYNSRAYVRPAYPRYGYAPHAVIVPRVIHPRIVTVVPYHPYVYRPSFSLGVFYGAGGSYPYGYTPRGYYDPLPGQVYGGLRITGAPQDAQVFADGYYVGIVNDFDGVFQHVNLEAGPHHIEIQENGYQPIAFDVNIQPGQTITYRAEF